MTWPPFNPDGRCPKCHHDDVRATYHANVHRPCEEYERAALSEPECCKAEHLHRRCVRCGFDWSEACA